ncbi:MAG: hypothetical protein Q7R58_02855 [bacterium]|nr:hypothetical protein [bacterium]
MPKLRIEKKFLYVVSALVLVFVLGVSYTLSAKNNIPQNPSPSENPVPTNSALIQSDVTQIALLSADLLRKENITASVGNTDEADKIRKAKERKEKLKRLARSGHPDAVLSAAIPADKKNVLSAKVLAEVEKDVNLTGELSVLHVDDFSNPKNSRFDNFLTVSGKRYELYSIQPINISPGAQISISGIALDEVVVVKAERNAIKERVRPPKLDSMGKQKTAVFLIDFLDSGPRPFSARTAKEAIFDGQFNEFYKEQSYGSVEFTGKVFGWFTLPRNAPLSGTCGAVGIEDFYEYPDIPKIVAKNNIDLSKYSRLVIIPSHPNLGGGCSFVGKNSVTLNGINYNLSVAWIGNATEYNMPSFWGAQPFSWTNLDALLSHELGHSLGVLHANGWECGNKSLHGNCEHIEYGNLFDVMGYGEYSLHFNALYKEMLGWIRPNTITAVSQSGKITLNPLEKRSGNGGFRAAKIQMPGTLEYPYYIEYRRGIGFDRNLTSPDVSSNQNGVLIDKRVDSFGLPFPRLIDATPHNTGLWGWYEDTKNATLNKNRSFEDPGRGIKVTTKSTDSVSAKVEVEFSKPKCVRQSPSIRVSFSSWEIPAGQTGYVGNDFSNTDYYGCGPSTFRSTFTLPSPLSIEFQYPENGKSVVAPENADFHFAGISIPENTPAGEYPVHYEVRNITGGSKKSSYDFVLKVCELSNCPGGY